MADYPESDVPRETPPAPVAKPTKRRPRRKTPSGFFDDDGLRALDAAHAAIDLGPLRYGLDGRFWAYDSGVWTGDGEKAVHRRMVDLLGNRYRPAHSNAIRDVVRALVPEIEAAPTPGYINFRDARPGEGGKGGLLDWRANRLDKHTPDVPSTVQLSVPWNPDAECPDFHAFMADVIAEDDRARVWEVIGYMLMSGNPLHRAFLFAGGGRNGKGAMMRTILALLGRSNVSNVPLHDLSSNRFATAQLYGRMANVCGDIDATYLENTGRIKEITGEDDVQAEHKFGQPFRFTAWCSMLFSANTIPGAADSSRGWVDRWEIIPFDRYVGDRVDKTLEPRLQAPESLAGIAVCAVAALRSVMDRGAFRTTDSGLAAKEEFARKSNPLYDYVEERTTLTDDGREKGTVVYEDYTRWAALVGAKSPMNRATFYAKMKQLPDRGITTTEKGGSLVFKGLKLGKLT